MQLPLSASALVMLGVAAVLIGAVVLVVELARRRKPASGSTRVPPDMRMPQQSAATSGPYAATPPVDEPAGAATQVSAERGPAPAAQAPEPVAPSVPQALAGTVPAAATPRPTEVSWKVDPPGDGAQVQRDRTPSGEMPAVSSRHQQAGSGRTVAAAVAQAFAVRAAAGRAGAPGPGVQRPADPPPSDDGVAAAQEGAAPQPEPARDEPVETAAAPAAGEHVPAPAVDAVDPAATTDPDGLGLAAMATSGAGEPEPQVSGNDWGADAAPGANGDRPTDTADHGPEGNGRQTPEPVASAPGAGLMAAGWTVPAPADPEPAAVPAPRPDTVDVRQQSGSASDPRDRLLAVLLDDPERAVGATVELETCLRELDRLSDAVRAGRAALRDVLHRLAATGLRPDQLARLARLPQGEVRELLEAAPAEQQA